VQIGTRLPRFIPIVSILLLAAACGGDPGGGSAESADLHAEMHRRGMTPMLDSSSVIRNASSPSGAHLSYFGGRINANAKVVQVLYGSGSYASQVSGTGTPSMATFYQQFLTGTTLISGLLQQYDTNTSGGTNQTFTSGAFQQQVTITPSSANNGSTIDDSNIQAELTAQIAAGHLPAPQTDAQGNPVTYYAVFFPPGKTITQGGSSSCVAGGFCAYHGTVAASSGHGEYYYGVHPDMQAGSGCATGCGNSTTFGNYCSVSSHELVEMMTDAEIGIATTVAAPIAWYDSNNGEIGDICNAQQGTFAGCDGQTYTYQLEFSNSAANGNACVTISPSCGTTNDFSISANPTSISVTAGNGSSSTISTAVAAGSAGTVTLAISGTGNGVSATLGASSVTAGNSTTLTVTTTAAATTGAHTITVTGTEGTRTHSTTVTVNVSAATGNDFSISASPSSVSVAAGNSTSSTISTATTSGSAQTVSLAVSGAPAGVTATLSPTSVTSGQSATLSIATTTSAAAGTYTLTVTGSAASGSHSAAVSLTITGGSGGGGIINGGFEAGSLSGWSASGASEKVVSSGCHGGTYCADLGATTPTNGDSTISQTFTAPSGTTGISLWYKMTCPDTVTYDWALVTLADNTAGTTATLLGKICTTNAWTNLTGSITAGHSYTLTLTSHDDNYSADPSFTLYDDVTLTSTTAPSGITTGGFESGSSGWTTAGTTSILSTGCHAGSGCARAGSTSPTNGDSSFRQTFTVPAGKTQLSFWYKMTCPDTVTYDWVTATLGSTTIVPKTCSTNSSWVNVTAAVTAGQTYTLTLISHDDNYSADPSFTLFDDVVLN
jgi:hypothetical protein